MTSFYVSKRSIIADIRTNRPDCRPRPSRWPRPADFLLALALSWGSIAGLVYAVYHWQVAR